MTPGELDNYLSRLVEKELFLSTMIWGPPGIGKSSIVAQVASRYRLGFTDLRLSQLAPTDLRGLPVAEAGLSRWFPPEFLPRESASGDSPSRGVLFLDELNMAPPAMQGIAQQLILDRRVGSYEVPRGWFIWAAGNRREDRAAVFEMPSALANRFVHLDVSPDFDAFKAHALQSGLDERVLAFLSFRASLLHKIDPQAPAWPSPRSWSMASELLGADLSIEPAVGGGAASEFAAYVSLYDALPDLEAILSGRGGSISFPREPSVRYALTIGLTVRADSIERGQAAFVWLAERASAEWVQLFASDLVRLLRGRGQLGLLAEMVRRDARLARFIQEYQKVLSG